MRLKNIYLNIIEENSAGYNFGWNLIYNKFISFFMSGKIQNDYIEYLDNVNNIDEDDKKQFYLMSVVLYHLNKKYDSRNQNLQTINSAFEAIFQNNLNIINSVKPNNLDDKNLLLLITTIIDNVQNLRFNLDYFKNDLLNSLRNNVNTEKTNNKSYGSSINIDAGAIIKPPTGNIMVPPNLIPLVGDLYNNIETSFDSLAVEKKYKNIFNNGVNEILKVLNAVNR